HAALDAAARCGEQRGEAVHRAAQAARRGGAQAAPGREGELVLDIGRRGGKAVGRIVDQDLDLERVDGREIGHYCGSSPLCFTTSRAAARSALISAANSSGVLIAGTWPRLMTYLSTKSLSAKTRRTSSLSLSTTAFGVPAGANSPYQVCDGAPL